MFWLNRGYTSSRIPYSYIVIQIRLSTTNINFYMYSMYSFALYHQFNMYSIISLLAMI